MAENDSKRYYWLKLKKDFFHQHQIKVLKSLPNGRLYALIYLELLAESTSHEGELRYSQLLPYDIVTLSAVIDEDKDNVEKAIETLIHLELIEILDDGTIFMREVQKLIGSETGQTIRKREAKLNSGNSVVKNTLEYRDKSIENRDKNILLNNTNSVYCTELSEDISMQVPIFQIPLNKKGTYHYVTQKEIDMYEQLYPNVNIIQEYRKMIGWCLANPTKLKTKNGIQRFINTWLSKEQDKGGNSKEEREAKIRSQNAYADDVELRKKQQEIKEQGGNWFE